jgi:transcriptional regulator with XRE-family HTH domain
MAISINVRFGANLRKIRLAKNFSQEQLAELSDLHRTYVSSVERGERNVTLQTAEKLAKALGISLSRLMPD